jgi:hypothetical protein
MASLSVRAWLEDLDPKYGEYVDAFTECGVDDVGDLAQMDESDLSTVTESLRQLGAKQMPLRRITTAARESQRGNLTPTVHEPAATPLPELRSPRRMGAEGPDGFQTHAFQARVSRDASDEQEIKVLLEQATEARTERNRKADIANGALPLGADAVGAIFAGSSLCGVDSKTACKESNLKANRLVVGRRAAEAGVRLVVGPMMSVSSGGAPGLARGIAAAITGPEAAIDSPDEMEALSQAALVQITSTGGDLFSQPPGGTSALDPLGAREVRAQMYGAVIRMHVRAAAAREQAASATVAAGDAAAGGGGGGGAGDAAPGVGADGHKYHTQVGLGAPWVQLQEVDFKVENTKRRPASRASESAQAMRQGAGNAAAARPVVDVPIATVSGRASGTTRFVATMHTSRTQSEGAVNMELTTRSLQHASMNGPPKRLPVCTVPDAHFVEAAQELCRYDLPHHNKTLQLVLAARHQQWEDVARLQYELLELSAQHELGTTQRTQAWGSMLDEEQGQPASAGKGAPSRSAARAGARSRTAARAQDASAAEAAAAAAARTTEAVQQVVQLVTVNHGLAAALRAEWSQTDDGKTQGQPCESTKQQDQQALTTATLLYQARTEQLAESMKDAPGWGSAGASSKGKQAADPNQKRVRAVSADQQQKKKKEKEDTQQQKKKEKEDKQEKKRLKLAEQEKQKPQRVAWQERNTVNKELDRLRLLRVSAQVTARSAQLREELPALNATIGDWTWPK